MEPFISHGFLIFQLLYFSPAEKTVSSSHLQLLLERSSVFLKLCIQISPVPVPADDPIPSSTLSEIGVSFETSKLRLELISADVSCRRGRFCWTLSAFLSTQKSAQKSKTTQKSALESKSTLLSAQKSAQTSGFAQKSAQMSSFTQKRAQMSKPLKKVLK